MIIDSHVHLKHGDINRTEYSPEEILKVMNAVGIDKSVVFAMSTTTERSIQMALNARRSNRLIPYVYALPSFERVVLEEIEKAITEYKFKGIKIHAGECLLAEYVINPVIRLAGELEVPCLIDFMGRYRDTERIAKSFPNTRIIAAHMGKYLCRDPGLIDKFIELARRYSNLYLDISGVVLVNKITEAAEKVGADRLIFGTDGPHKQPTTIEYARRELDKVRSLPLSSKEKSLILGGNIAKLLRIQI